MRKQNCPCKIQQNPSLKHYVLNHLKSGWSPEQIAGRMRRKGNKYTVCHETIYRYIYKQKNKELFYYLANKKPKRMRKFARKPRICSFGHKRIITNRPNIIESRRHCGHWEGDRIVFRGNNYEAVTTLVERKTRLVLLIKNSSKYSKEVMGRILKKFSHGPKNVCKSITFDQGVEFAGPQLLERELGCKVFYCHTHSPWEKGSNENMNGRLRRYLPSTTNISELSQTQLDELSQKFNNTPRKVLGYKTPIELFLQHFNLTCRTWV